MSDIQQSRLAAALARIDAVNATVPRGYELDTQRVGTQMAAYRAVTHCYQRPTYPDWPYNIFTMIHARSRDECHAVVEQIAHETGITAHGVLFSTKEYKKVRVQYFTAAEAEWEAQHCENRTV